MVFKKYSTELLFKVLLLFAALCAGAYLLVKGWYIYEWLCIPLVVYLLRDFYRSHIRMQQETAQFMEAVHARDFTLHFNTQQSPQLKLLRESFNSINATFRTVAKERETQSHYLQQVLEMADTGMLSYDAESGNVEWMNGSLKQLLRLPSLKNIQGLSKRDPDLLAVLQQLKPRERRVIRVRSGNSTNRVLVAASTFHTADRQSRLLVFQNVSEALEETESRAWQKLLNVMTHEIMNSVAPISSLADTLKTRLGAALTLPPEQGAGEDILLGIDTIKKRSDGLLKFAETYRSLHKITTVHQQEIWILNLFESLYRLMQPSLLQKHLSLEIILKDPTLTLRADTTLLEQVLINLLLNAVDAVKHQQTPQIVLSAYVSDNKTIVQLADNGTGMDKEILEHVFIPFFTTKKNGSGIGLSLCKQIMLLHGGNIQVVSEPGKGSTFLLVFAEQ